MLTIVSVRDGEDGALERAVANLHKQRVDGIVAIAPLVSIGESLTALAQQIPLVAVESSPRASLPIVSVDQAAGARIATDHLLVPGASNRLACQRPARCWYESQDRVAGWTAALAPPPAAEIPARSSPVTGVPRSGYEAGH